MADVSVFGIGYVGVVSAACLAEDGHNVIAVDVDRSKVDALNSAQAPIIEEGLPELLARHCKTGRLTATTDIEQAIQKSDISLICVGTPSQPDGSVDLRFVRQVCREIGAAMARKGTRHTVVVRSTMVPGSMDEICVPELSEHSGLRPPTEFGVAYYPEFLREGTAIEDYRDPGLVVLGVLDEETEVLLRRTIVPAGSFVVTLATAEAAKYASNYWRAVKITFANEIGNIAKACGLDGQQIMKLICSDTKVNISPSFMKPGFAFGGSCLPKDIRALRYLAEQKGVHAPLLTTALEANAEQIARVQDLVERSGKKKVGLVGVSFKSGTDDLRESPLAKLGAHLISNGFDLKVYDPYVAESVTMGSSRHEGSEIPDLPRRLVRDIDQLISSSEIIVVGNHYTETLAFLSEAATSRVVIDLVRISPDLRSNGLYEGICW